MGDIIYELLELYDNKELRKEYINRLNVKNENKLKIKTSEISEKELQIINQKLKQIKSQSYYKKKTRKVRLALKCKKCINNNYFCGKCNHLTREDLYKLYDENKKCYLYKKVKNKNGRIHQKI